MLSWHEEELTRKAIVPRLALVAGTLHSCSTTSAIATASTASSSPSSCSSTLLALNRSPSIRELVAIAPHMFALVTIVALAVESATTASVALVVAAAERPRWAELLRSGVAILDLDYDAIVAAMYAFLLSLVLRLLWPCPCASRYFFRDSTTLTPLSALVPVRLADPSGGPVLAGSSTVFPCPAVPTGSLSGLHLPSFSRKLTLQWHHRLGHPSLSRLRGTHSRLLFSRLPRSLPPLPPLPAPPCLPCIEGRQRAAPHSSFPPTTAPLQTLQIDVWGPARVSGQGRERYFLLVVDDYTRYTTDLPVLRLHSDRGEFSSDLLRDFCRGEGILQSFMLPASPQQNGIAECCIGLVMELARTSRSMRYVAHQLNLWPRVSLPATSPTLCWTGEVGDASVFRDVTFDELDPFYRLFPYRSTPLPPPLLLLAPGAARGAVSGGAASGGAEPEGAGSGGAELGGAEPWGAEPASAEHGGAELEGAEAGGAESVGVESGGAERRGTGAGGVGATRHRGAGVPAGAGGTGDAGATDLGGARTRGTGAAGTSGVGGAGAGGAGAGDPGAGGARAGGAGAGGAGVGGARARDPGIGGAGAGGTGAESTGAGGAGAGGPGAGDTGAVDPGAGGAGAGGAVSGGTGLPPSLLSPLPRHSLPPLQPDSPQPAPSPYAEQTDSFTERRGPESHPASPVHVVRTGRQVSRPRPPPVPGTHVMALRPSYVPLQDPLPPPPESSLSAIPDPESDLARTTAASALVAKLVDFVAACRLDYAAILVAESESDCPLSIGGECALGTDGLEDRQEDFECLAAAVPHLVAMLLAPEGDPDAPDISTPRCYTEEITVPPSRPNIVDGMWNFKGVDFFQTFSPILKMTTLRVLLAAFLEEIWLRRPPGFIVLFPAGTQWSLRWPVYGLRQAPCELLDTLNNTLAALGFAPLTADPSLFRRTDTLLPPFSVLVYFDDLVFATADTEALALVLQRFGFRYTSPKSTPLPSGHMLSAPPSDESVEPSGPYPELVGYLIHRSEHWEAAKRALRYLCNTSGMGLVLGGRGLVVLTGHADASWVDDLATSSCEAEIYAGAMAAQEVYAGAMATS
ncbi:unnamed protein product [Closterium sp. NIES-53]